jgi:hypothetical protein
VIKGVRGDPKRVGVSRVDSVLRRRRWIVRRKKDGWRAIDVAAALRIDERTVYRWWSFYRKQGWAGLEVRSRAPHKHYETPEGTVNFVLQLAAGRKKNSNPEREPTFLISDGLASYPTAVSREFRNTVHLARVGIQSEVSNNRIERFHGTVRERNKVMRAIKKPNSAIIEGQRIYYNHIRPHAALNGKTPAEACGIEAKGKNKWLTLIQNASTAT